MTNKKSPGSHTPILSFFLERQMCKFVKLNQDGYITPALEKDYHEFMNVVTETFQADPGAFNLDTVFKKIPRNTWLQTCVDKFE